MRLHSGLLLLTLLAPALTYAQQPSPWQGEWGRFSDSTGARLTITDCSGPSCKFFLDVEQNQGRCSSVEDTTTFTVLSSTEATVTMPGEDSAKSCILHLERTSTPPSITITPSGNDCAYYCTSNATFGSTLPFRSTTIFNTQHLDDCFANPSPATLATCNDPSLGALERTWSDLYADFPLQGHHSDDENGYTYAKTIDAAILKQCDTAPTPADCLRTRFTAEIAAMNANKAAFIAGYTDRGDPDLATKVAARIAGRYRHSFESGDVQGDSYRATDTLTLTPISRNSIHFNVHLNFYNGHTCDLSGGALFRKDGSFVFDDVPADTNADSVCHLAIVPTAKGVELHDLTGSGCKNISCGERGGYNGAGFSFSDRVSAKKDRVSTGTTPPAKKPSTR